MQGFSSLLWMNEWSRHSVRIYFSLGSYRRWRKFSTVSDIWFLSLSYSPDKSGEDGIAILMVSFTKLVWILRFIPQWQLDLLFPRLHLMQYISLPGVMMQGACRRVLWAKYLSVQRVNVYLHECSPFSRPAWQDFILNASSDSFSTLFNNDGIRLVVRPWTVKVCQSICTVST